MHLFCFIKKKLPRKKLHTEFHTFYPNADPLYKSGAHKKTNTSITGQGLNIHKVPYFQVYKPQNYNQYSNQMAAEIPCQFAKISTG